MLDKENIPKDLLFQNLRELEAVNVWLGGLRITKLGFKRSLQMQMGNKREIKVADIGCGGGDALRAMASYADQKNLKGEFVGIDMKSDCIDYAQASSQGFDTISFVKADYRDGIRKDPEITHVHAALFCHHLTDEEFIELLRYCRQEKMTLIINDLHRHPLAYYSIWFITRLFRGSKLIQHDAPLSVLRGFKKKELRSLLDKAEITTYYLRWKWAFRYLIIIPNE